MTNSDDLAALTERLEQSGDLRNLQRFPTVTQYAGPSTRTKLRRKLIVDVQTTGLDPTRDTIIELAILPFDFTSEGKRYDEHDGYPGFEDSGMTVSETVIDDEVRGFRLDDDAVPPQ